MHRWLRVLICLLLVCCILVNLSPLKSEAVSTAAIACSVAIPVAVAIGLQAVGVRQGSSPSAFNQVVSDAVDALSPEWAVNGLTTMLALTTDGLTKTFASQNFLQALLDFLHDTGILSSSFDDTYPPSMGVLTLDEAIAFASRYPYAWRLNYSSVSTGVMVSTGPVTFYSGYPVGYSVDGAAYIWSEGTGTFSSRDSAGSIYCDLDDIVSIGGNAVVTTSEDLTLESVGHDIETDYETYVETGIVGVDFGVQFEDDPNTDRNEEDDGNDLWLPVGIPGGSTDGSYTDQTQQDAQSGNTPQDVLDELLQNSGSGDGSGDGTGSDSGSGNGSGNTWKPPSDHNVFALADLSKFFPFCIPFDLYDFFTLLNAEPVAPVLSWEIKDLAGQTYSLDVDLSQWDSVALLFRRLQLFLFITGLAAASRKFIKW